ncbi:MAG: FAD:protein FMN transferase [Cyclobacteriaceae bacterium]|nr:FAD:protein FMN transferase [Cyclobacteriaceae bacterium]MCH8515075.1 FAD:protein FMN transferase [Cyclobacteriaceae bacterium]
MIIKVRLVLLTISLSITISLLLVTSGLLPAQTLEPIKISGETMGTYYQITYIDTLQRDLKPQVDSMLTVFNQSLSTYISDSEISTFNKTSTFSFQSPFFYPMLKLSEQVYVHTEGAFDPTVMPIVNLWGFGPEKRPEQKPSEQEINERLSLVGFSENISFDQSAVKKSKDGVSLDFSAIAKGYGADVIGELLQSYRIDNYLVEIGGDLVTHGFNPKGKGWKLGIEHPQNFEDEQPLSAIVTLGNQGMATSGNYRNYRIIDGKKVAHTIHPKTGRPEAHNLLSSTVIAKSCALADAYATAFMVMGYEAAVKFIDESEDLDAVLIFVDNEGNLHVYYSEGIDTELIKTK